MSARTQIDRLTPIYTTPAPDIPVRLHEGRLGIRQGGYYGEGDGTLDLVWTSHPKILFDIPSLDPVHALRLEQCVLTLPSLNAEALAYICGYPPQPRRAESLRRCGESRTRTW